jgi:hypothetical protein
LFFTAALFSAFHDRLIFTETPSFPRLRQDSLFLSRCPFLLYHDIFIFTEMPSFGCATIFMISPSRPSFVVPQYF